MELLDSRSKVVRQAIADLIGELRKFTQTRRAAERELALAALLAHVVLALVGRRLPRRGWVLWTASN